jgi:hypothetical protein
MCTPHPSHPRSEGGTAQDASAEHIGTALQQRPHPAAPWRPHGGPWVSSRESWMGLRSNTPPLTASEARQLSILAEHTDDIRHIAGKENIVADTLSRPPPSGAAVIKEPSGSPVAAWQDGKPESSSPSGSESAVVFAVPANGQLIDFAAIAAHQRGCRATLQARKTSSLRLQAVEVMGASLLSDISTGVPRPLIPVEDRKAVFYTFLSLAHAGTRVTQRLVAARAVWRGMNSDVAAWVRDCQQCCRGKVTGQPAAPVQPIHVPGKRFSHMHVDLVGPLPVAEDGSTYIFTMVDRSTRWSRLSLCAQWRPRLAWRPSSTRGWHVTGCQRP